MEHRSHGIDEETLIAERAAEWLRRVEGADAREQERFLNWLRRSPQNGGELLVAASTEIAMRQLLRDKHIDVHQFLSASANVITVNERAQTPQQPPRGKRLRLIAVASLGGAVATSALLLTPTLVRSWIYPCEYVRSAGEEHTIKLLDGSAIAIDADSDVLVSFSANARSVYLSSGRAMFSIAGDSVRPLVHVVSAGDEAPSAGRAATLDPRSTIVDVRRVANRIDDAAIEEVMLIRARPPVTVFAGGGELPGMTVAPPRRAERAGLITAAKPVSMDRSGEKVLIRFRPSLTQPR